MRVVRAPYRTIEEEIEGLSGLSIRQKDVELLMDWIKNLDERDDEWEEIELDIIGSSSFSIFRNIRGVSLWVEKYCVSEKYISAEIEYNVLHVRLKSETEFDVSTEWTIPLEIVE